MALQVVRCRCITQRITRHHTKVFRRDRMCLATACLLGGEVVEHGQGDIGQQRCEYAPNAMGNFSFDVTLGYRRLERPRRPGSSV
jgi:hypothetical protein